MKETKRGKKERITVMLLICNTVQLCALYNSLLSLQEKVVFLLNGHTLLTGNDRENCPKPQRSCFPLMVQFIKCNWHSLIPKYL